MVNQNKYHFGQLQVLYEDNHIIAVSKPAGMSVQPDLTKEKSLVEYVEEYLVDKYNKKGRAFVGLVHRIDKPVTGIVLFTRTSRILSRIHWLFKNREIHKGYWAITERKPDKDSDFLEHYLIKSSVKNKSYVTSSKTKGAHLAQLNYKVIKELPNNKFLIEVNPVTGRHHQIRVQLSKINAPIMGDIKYSASKPNKDKSIALHARTLQFIHPIKNIEIFIQAPVPLTDPYKVLL